MHIIYNNLSVLRNCLLRLQSSEKLVSFSAFRIVVPRELLQTTMRLENVVISSYNIIRNAIARCATLPLSVDLIFSI